MSTDDIQTNLANATGNLQDPSEAVVPLPLHVSSYDYAYSIFLQSVFQGYVADNELLRNIQVVQDRHCGSMRNVRDEMPLDQPMVEMSVGITIQRDAIRKMDLDEYIAMLDRFAHDMLAAQTQHFLKSMGAVSDAASMTVSNDGHGIPTLVQFREALQRMELCFDDDGKLQQQLVVHSSQADRAAALLQAAENDPECQRIVAEKKMKWMELRAALSHRTLLR